MPTSGPEWAGRCSPTEWYAQRRNAPGFRADPAQQRAVQRLQQLYDELLEFKLKRNRRLSNMFARSSGRAKQILQRLPFLRPRKDAAARIPFVRRGPRPPKGAYFWGGVGRGKSLLMDSFFAGLPYKRKRRIHFHHFMREVHARLKDYRGESDPLQKVGHAIAAKTRVLCFDEFHVSDIADAMILARLLQVMFDLGVVLVITSNYRPDDLYPNGLQRANFLPAIALINQNLDVINVDGGIDYRLRTLERVPTFLHPINADTSVTLASIYQDMATSPDISEPLVINDHMLPSVRRSSGVAWFSFADLCGAARSQFDYLELASIFHTLLLADVPRLTPDMASEARRFTWLIDILYDHRVKLIISANAAPADLYREGINSGEFFRTVSRLEEMQSKEYLAQPHLSVQPAR